MCCRTLLDPAAREVLKPTLLELCRQSFKQLLDKEKAAQAKQVDSFFFVYFSCYFYYLELVSVCLERRPRRHTKALRTFQQRLRGWLVGSILALGV